MLPNMISFKQGDGEWSLTWEITRPVRMWAGMATHRYGSGVCDVGELDWADFFEALDLIREQFDMTMEVLDQPAWKRLWRRIELRLPMRLRMLPLYIQLRLPARLQLWIMDRDKERNE